MTLGTATLLVYGLLMIAGGAMGARAGSKVSLAAGGGSGLLLLIAWLLAYNGIGAGIWLGTAIAFLLSVTFGMRLKKSGKFMPAGMLLVVSIAALVLLVISIRG